MCQVKIKTKDRKTVFNLAMLNRTEFVLVGISVLISANFILLCLFLLSTPVANFLIILIRDNNNGYPGKSDSSGAPGH